MKHTQVYWLHVLSPTHVGTGRGVGYIDLPIHRDKVTGWPLIPGSAFKGVWADHFRATEDARRTDPTLGLAFGRASDQETHASNAGALIPTDARLVCLPIRSFHGTFAWCTSPLALQLLHRDLALAGMANLPRVPPAPADGTAYVTDATKLKDGDRVYLEDLDFIAKETGDAAVWANCIAAWVFPGDDNQPWRERFAERFTIVADPIFDFLTETGTEVVTRVRIDETLKTVKDGQLWTEEALPAEAILAGMIACDRVYAREPDKTVASAQSKTAAGEAGKITANHLIKKFASDSLQLQLGGKATVGRGRVQCIFTPASGRP